MVKPSVPTIDLSVTDDEFMNRHDSVSSTGSLSLPNSAKYDHDSAIPRPSPRLALALEQGQNQPLVDAVEAMVQMRQKLMARKSRRKVDSIKSNFDVDVGSDLAVQHKAVDDSELESLRKPVQEIGLFATARESDTEVARRRRGISQGAEREVDFLSRERKDQNENGVQDLLDKRRAERSGRLQVLNNGPTANGSQENSLYLNGPEISVDDRHVISTSPRDILRIASAPAFQLSKTFNNPSGFSKEVPTTLSSPHQNSARDSSASISSTSSSPRSSPHTSTSEAVNRQTLQTPQAGAQSNNQTSESLFAEPPVVTSSPSLRSSQASPSPSLTPSSSIFASPRSPRVSSSSASIAIPSLNLPPAILPPLSHPPFSLPPFVPPLSLSSLTVATKDPIPPVPLLPDHDPTQGTHAFTYHAPKQFPQEQQQRHQKQQTQQPPATLIEVVQNELLQAVNATLSGQAYDALSVKGWSHAISRDAVSQLGNLQRPFKFVVIVAIFKPEQSGFHMVSGCLWDKDADGSVTIRWDNKTIRCVASAYGVYLG
eukprot:c7126_g1_i1.p1 GENE.c7126_g1_i1~~c7126_g1_i1.p1  ORF type:complete len:542 (+),score=88.85 c7126_g1_i1:414-2039(+)